MRKTILDLSDAKEIFNQVLAHWKQSNEYISPKEVLLKGSYSRTDFLNQAVEFDHLGELVDKRVEYRDRCSEQLNLYKENMRSTMQRFSFIARGVASDPILVHSIPALPDTRSNEEKFMEPVDKIVQIWTDLNVDGEVCLSDGTNLAAFVAGVQILRQSFRNRERAFEQERYARAIRRQHHQMLIERCVQYRSLVLGIFGEDSPVGNSLPYLWAKQDRRRKLTVVEPSHSLSTSSSSESEGTEKDHQPSMLVS
jgi:hypothetical protein